MVPRFFYSTFSDPDLLAVAFHSLISLRVGIQQVSSGGSLPPLNQSQCRFYVKLKLCFSQCSFLPDATVAPVFSSSLSSDTRQNDASTGCGQQTDANAAEGFTQSSLQARKGGSTCVGMNIQLREPVNPVRLDGAFLWAPPDDPRLRRLTRRMQAR